MSFFKPYNKFILSMIVIALSASTLKGNCRFDKLVTNENAEIIETVKKSIATGKTDDYLSFLGLVLRYEERVRNKRSLFSVLSGALTGQPHRDTKNMLQALGKELNATLSPTELKEFRYGLVKQLERGRTLQLNPGLYTRVSGDFSASESNDSLVGGTLEYDGVNLAAYRPGIRAYLFRWATDGLSQ